MDIIFLTGRVIFGLVFVIFGINHFKDKRSLVEYAKSKNLPMPESSVIWTGVLMIFSGTLLILGIFPDVALTLIATFLIIVSFKMHSFWKLPKEKQAHDKTSFLMNMAVFGACLMLLYLTYWPISL